MINEYSRDATPLHSRIFLRHYQEQLIDTAAACPLPYKQSAFLTVISLLLI